MTTLGKLLSQDAQTSSRRATSESSRREVRTGLEPCLAHLWRYALVLPGTSDAAEDLVRATCLRAVERADQFVPGAGLDRWPFVNLRSIWLNETRVRRISESGKVVDAKDALGTGGEQAVETEILAADLLKAIGPLTEAQSETVLLVYAEGYGYAETASALENPYRYRDAPPRRSAFGAKLSLQPPYRQNLHELPDRHRGPGVRASRPQQDEAMPLVGMTVAGCAAVDAMVTQEGQIIDYIDDYERSGRCLTMVLEQMNRPSMAPSRSELSAGRQRSLGRSIGSLPIRGADT